MVDDNDNDDDEGGEPACPFCDAEPNCKHLVAFFEGGPTCENWCGVARWSEFEAAVRAGFAPLLKAGELEGVLWSNDDVQALWAYAVESTPAEQRWAGVEVEPYVLGRIVREALLDAGALEVEGNTHSAGGEWSAAGFFSRRPKTVFKTAVAAIGDAISSAARAPKPRQRGSKHRTTKTRRR